MSRKGYYGWKKCKFSKHKQYDDKLLTVIKQSHVDSNYVYGAPRIHSDLKDMGYNCSIKRVNRIMRENNIRSKVKRKFKATTNSKHNYPVHPNLLEQNFKCDAPNKVWTTDITYIPTDDGWLYLAVVLDLYSRMIIGWSMDKTMTRKLTMDALAMAYWQRKPGNGLVHHSDRGSQYASNDYQNMLKNFGMICSMSKKGDCYDNAVTESFFHTLKTELVFDTKYSSREYAKSDIFKYIELFYNRKRKHSTLGYCSPADFEQYYGKVA